MSNKKNEKVMVSISCITYNHAKFIKDALDSFLMQETDFKFEVLINDDASTDGTTEIIKEYESKYPDIIKPNYQKENQYSKGVRGMSKRFNYPRAKGRYIAHCEGDDYWTDPKKLQKQVDFLEQNEDHALVFHLSKMVYPGGEEKPTVFPDIKKLTDISIPSLIKWNFIPTNSVMYRHLDYSSLIMDITPGDRYLHLFHANHGKIGFINEVMSVYRRHEGGIWWDSYKDRGNIWVNHGHRYLDFYNEIRKMFDHDNKCKKAIDMAVRNLFIELAAVDDKNLTKKPLLEATKSYPEEAAKTIKHLSERLTDREQKVNDLREAIEKRDKAIEHKNREIAAKNKEIGSLRSTIAKRVRERAKNIIKAKKRN